ncbi:hypothetical protein Trydic_g4796, partial [Trypoxylus dichotomus]
MRLEVSWSGNCRRKIEAEIIDSANDWKKRSGDEKV